MSSERGHHSRGRSTWRGGRGRGRGRGFFGGVGQRSAAKQALAEVATETKTVLPFILKDLPNIRADESELLTLDTDLPPLKREDCPRHDKATIKVVNEDTFNAALSMMAFDKPKATGKDQVTRVAVLNLASDTSPGGGWLNGAMAQEEALCYRSSLSLSLHKKYYPWGPLQGVYTRDVVIFRSSTDNGHKLLAPKIPASELPVVSVLSVAAIRRPKHSDAQVLGSGGVRKVFADKEDRELTKKKMRLILRMASLRAHDRLVLGALGCGAFRNPVEEVADLWKEVLEEAEFGGGWWREMVFAVFDRKNEGNFEVFETVLGGMKI
ncbi:hypothetical protein VPNG_00118 [Cytospora leucostoma]|uniref:Microbial-type PARG catalytic domain-containing protein n=1 Tax=Cytospora leucostoma TaxID=1230097 RepID=A0A423XNH4_9PEZI|nr:hypothetical protein VPNG_00118 [Cytospora leucostoma]